MLSDSRHELNYWPSFVDIFASLFFVFLVLFAVFYTGTIYSSKVIEKDIDDLGQLLKDSGIPVEYDTTNFNLIIPADILFDTDDAVLKRGRNGRLGGIEVADKVGKALFIYMSSKQDSVPRYKKYSIIIEGHTDTRADDKYNDDLSLERANAMISAMKLHMTTGVKDSIEFIPVGYGEHRLRIKQVGDVQENRRVEIRIVPKFNDTIKDYWRKKQSEQK